MALGALKSPNGWVNRIVRRMAMCGTGELGVVKFKCSECGTTIFHGVHCGSRNCPSCGDKARAIWVDKLSDKVLPVPHFHAVFTLPHELNNLIRNNQHPMLNLLMKSVEETLKCFVKKTFGGEPAFVMILHTWTQTLNEHYHIHVLIAGGAYHDNKWISRSSKYLFPVRGLAKMFRAKFLLGLLKLIHKDIVIITKEFPLPALPKKWHVYCAPALKYTSTIIKYFGLYANRIGISDRRILGHDGSNVTIALKRELHEKDPDLVNSRKDGNTVTMPKEDFINRFAIHILPPYFRKIRYIGLYAPSSKLFQEAKEALAARLLMMETIKSVDSVREYACKTCNKGIMQFVERLMPKLLNQATGPP